MPFVVSVIYRNDLFAMDINEGCWRFKLEYVDQQVCIQKLTGNELEYKSVIALLGAKFNLNTFRDELE